MRPAIRRRLAIALLVSAGLAIPLLVGWFPQEPLRAPAERLAGELLGARVSIGELTLTPGLLRLRVDRVRVEAPGWDLEARTIEAALDASVLLGGEPSLRALTVASPRVVLAGPRETPAGEAGQPRAVRIDELLISDGEVRTANEAGDFLMRSLSARGAIGTDAPLQLDGSIVMAGDSPAIDFRSTLVVGPHLTVEVRTARVETGTSHLELSGTLGDLDLTSMALSFQARLALEDLPLDLDGAAARFAGQGSLRSDSQGLVLTAKIDSVDADGSLDVTGSWKDGAIQARVRVESFDPRALLGGDIHSLTPDHLSGLIQVAGPVGGPLDVEVELDARRDEGLHYALRGELDGSIEADEPSLDVAWRAAGRVEDGFPPWLGPVSLELGGVADGAWPPRIQADLALRTTATAATTPLALELDGRLVNQGSRSTLRGELRSSDGTSGNVLVDLGGDDIRDLSAHLESVSLDTWLPNVRGIASGRVRLAGPVDALTGTAHLSVEKLGVAGLEVGAASATLELAPDQKRATVALPALRIRSKLTLSDEGDLSGELELRDTPLRDVIAAFGLPTESASATGIFSFDLPLAQPVQGSVSGRIDAATWQNGDLHMKLAQPLRVELTGGVLALDDLLVEGPGFRLSGSGEVDLPARDVDASVDLDVDVTALAIESMTGTVLANVTIRGSLDGLDAQGEVRVANLDTGSRLPWPLRVEQGTLRLARGAFEVEPTDISLAGGSVRLSGRGSLGAITSDSEDDAHLELDWRDLELGRLIASGADSPVVEGRISGRAVLDGALRDPTNMRARVSVPGFALSIDDRPIKVAPFALEMKEGVVSTDAIRVGSDAGSVVLAGSVDVVAQTLDLTARGDMEARMLSLLLPAVAISGAARTDLGVTGPWDNPEVSGRATLANGAVRLRELPLAIDSVNGSLVLEGDQLRIESLSGTLGGGTVEVTGLASIRDGALGEMDVSFLADGIGLEYPPGLRSRLEIDVSLRGEPGQMKLSGYADVVQGSYDLDRASAVPVSAGEDSPLLRSVELEIQVATVTPVRVRRDTTRIDAMGHLTLRGDLGRPQPFGRFDVRPGGRFQLQARDFKVDSGSIVYEGSWNPRLAAAATARITDGDTRRTYDVTLSVAGSLERPDLAFTSRPGLSQPQLVALIATGEARQSSATAQAWMAGEQAAVALTGQLSRSATEGLRRFGLDEVSIRPELAAREVRPGARLTFGKRLTPELRLVYSMSLEGPQARFFELEANPYRSFNARAQRRDDGSYTFGVGQRVRIGGGSETQRFEEEEVRLREIELLGALPLEETLLLSAGRIEIGSRVGEWELQDAADRMRILLISEGHIEASVGARLDAEAAIVRFNVAAGPRYTWRIEGMREPPDLRDVILGSLDEGEATAEGREQLLGELWKRGYPFAAVVARRGGDSLVRELSFSVDPGERVGSLRLTFPGATRLSRSALIEACGAAHRSLSDPGACRAGIAAAYRRSHYLSAQVGEPVVVRAAGEVRVLVEVQEGPRARLETICVQGPGLDVPSLVALTGLEIGAVVDQPDIELATARLREHFYSLGHASVSVVPRLLPSDGDYRLDFEVEPGPAARVESISLSGLGRTNPALVAGRLTLEPGDLLDPRQIARSERRLMETGLFNRVTISARGADAHLNVELEELPRYTLAYDLRYNDDRGATALLEAEVGNLLGRGLALGARGQLGSDLQELRATATLPLLGGTLLVQAFELDETLDAEIEGEQLQNQRLQREVEAQHSVPLRPELRLIYGYRFKRATTTSPLLPFPIQQDIARFDAALVRDTRDDLLDARRGSFLAFNLTLAPGALGSDFKYVKGFAQAAFAKPLAGTVTWAHGYRLGLGVGLSGQRIVSTERFYAGGAYSLRGFGEREAGPRGFLGSATGGEAVVVVNQELRYHHPRSGIGVVAFYDVGNVFRTVREMQLDLRHTLGAGVRYISPIGLLRLDLGWLVDAREGEQRTRWHLSVGQAF